MTPKHRSPKSPGLLSRRVASENTYCLTKTSLFLSDQSLDDIAMPFSRNPRNISPTLVKKRGINRSPCYIFVFVKGMSG